MQKYNNLTEETARCWRTVHSHECARICPLHVPRLYPGIQL